MAFYDDIYEIAADNYGMITSGQAKEMGISDKEMSRLASDGRLQRIGHGLYIIKHYVPTPNDPYARTVALVGKDAYLWGESVIAMHELAPTNPSYIYVGTPFRVRKNLPSGVRIMPHDKAKKITQYEGIPSQSIPDAILSARGRMMTERLEAAAIEARRQGYITEIEEQDLLEELKR
jgi:predicted transcriptional regulator of viral defense system